MPAKTQKTMIDNMPEKTGKSLEEWKKVLSSKSFQKHSEAVKFLKTEHGVTHGFANTIVTLSKEKEDAPEDLVANQYQGKENLREIYEALIKPATKTRIDLGLKLPDKELTPRLGNSGPFGTMCTHRVQLSQADQLDEELLAWLKEAYERSR